MNVGELIEMLEQFDPGMPVSFDATPAGSPVGLSRPEGRAVLSLSRGEVVR